jgi:hypothetical protein
MAGTAAWAAGTAIAVTLAWLGAEVVLRHAAAAGPQVLVPGAASPASPAPSPSAGPGAASPVPSPRRAPAPGVLPSRSSPPSGPRPGTVRSYALTGGRVTLLIARTSVHLVAATPVSGFSVQTWSAAGWLRVDFTQGSGVSSLIATWNSGAPTVQIFTD